MNSRLVRMIMKIPVLFCAVFTLFMLSSSVSLCSKNQDTSKPRLEIAGQSNSSNHSGQNNNASKLQVSAQASNQRPMSNAEYKELCKDAQAYDVYCREMYRMGPNELENMMNMGYEDFVHKLLTDPRFTDAILVRRLWKEYLSRYICKRKDNVEKYSQIIENELIRRDRELVAALQRQQIIDDENKKRAEEQRKTVQKETERLQKIYDPALLSDLHYISSFQRQREEALLKTKATGYARYEKKYNFDVQTAGMLTAQGVDYEQFKSLSGTLFQHQLFQEVAESYKKVAKIVFEYQLKDSFINPHVIAFAQASFACTKLEAVDVSMRLSDIADILAESSFSVCKGIIESACNLVDMVTSPYHTAKQLGRILVPILRFLGGALILYDSDSTQCINNREVAQQVFDNDIQAFNQMCEFSKQEFIKWKQNSSGQEKIQMVSKCIVDLVAQPKLIGMAGKACWGLISQARELRVLENIASLTEELGGAEIVDNILQVTQQQEQLLTTVGEVSVELQESLVTLIEAESNSIVQESAKILQSGEMEFNQVLEQLKLYGAPYSNPQFQKEVLLHFNEQFCKEELLEFCKRAKELYGNIRLFDNGKEIELISDIEHMLTYNLKFKQNHKLGLIEGFISGGHVGIMTKELELAGIISVVEEEMLFGGARYLKYKHLFGNYNAKKTEYPLSWSGEKIMKANIEAYQNFIEEKALSGQLFARRGFSEDGLEIVLLCQNMLQNKVKLITAYPYYEKISVFK